jgi:hypothetical protein
MGLSLLLDRILMAYKFFKIEYKTLPEYLKENLWRAWFEKIREEIQCFFEF